jgi:hydroxymethylglutaryl-CoA lyase
MPTEEEQMSEGWRLHRATLPERVVVAECWARDGLQNETKIVPTDEKVEMITRVVEAGFRKVEATSFAHPKYLPQFADAEEVLRRVPRKPGVDYRAICTTRKAVERAIRSRDEGYGVHEIAMVIAASEAYNQVNVNRGREENQRLIEELSRPCLESGHTLFGWVVTSFGCPITGNVPLGEVARLGRWWKDIGAKVIGFGDTVGHASPLQASRFGEYLLSEGFTADEVVLHFHDTRGWGIANCLTALTLGFRNFDASLGAIGGQAKTGTAAYQYGHSGNASTEDLVTLFEAMGVSTGIDLEKLRAAGLRAEQVLGRKLRSHFLEADLPWGNPGEREINPPRRG